MHAIAVARESATKSLAVRVGIDVAKDVFELAFADVTCPAIFGPSES
jgi:hypothetical protein